MLYFNPARMIRSTFLVLTFVFAAHVHTGSLCQGADAFHLLNSKTSQQQQQQQRNKSPSSASSSSSSALSATTDQQQRKPWDILRFLRQSSRFVEFPMSSSRKPSSINDGPITPGTVLWEAGDNKQFSFGPLDDVVMGGASASTFDQTTGKWRGVVTDANNGGFVGIRSTPTVEYDLSPCKGIEWTLRVIKPKTTLNNLRLKVVVRDSTEFNGITWASSQDVSSASSSSSTSTTIKIPFSKQIPTRFAKTVPQTEPFNQSQVKSFQLVYSKFEYDGKMNPNFVMGDFEFQLVQLKTF